MDVHSPADAPAPGILNPPLLRTLVVCDIADSTALVEKLGDQQAAQLVRKHDRLARALLEQHHGREIDKTDGFLLLFERPIHAVAFALDYQRGLKHLSAAEGVVVRARVGIHMGDVVVWENSPEDVARGAKPIEIEGLAKPMAARLAQLAQPRQILLTAAAASIAHRAHGELGDCAAHVRWRALGRYLFKGLPEAVEVHEVGEESVAAFRAPRGSRTARRILPWWRRPAVLAAEAAMLALAVGVTAWMSTRSEPALAFAARDWVVVGDLQNLTGNSTFDQSVETALRISLEQSRYVNVLPELKVQETLQRMERDPAKTMVDRGVGSEIAMREGVRALILPSIAEIGGRLRVTAEVIDPRSQATVYSESADGVGAASVLSSVDHVTRKLRNQLGETLANIKADSLPLSSVTTGNLDALRAYTLGTHAQASGKSTEALAFYSQALKLDPGFAEAYMAIARVYYNGDDMAKAKEAAEQANAHRDRLVPREALYLDALLASIRGPADTMLEKWKLLTSMYPDYYSAAYAYALLNATYTNRFDLSLPYASRATDGRYPFRPSALYLTGALQLGEEQYASALESFKKAEDAGVGGTRDAEAGAYGAVRDFSAAQRIVERDSKSGLGNSDMVIEGVRVTLAVDQGHWREASELSSSAQKKAKQTSDLEARIFQGIDLTLRSYSAPSSVQAGRLRDFLRSEVRRMQMREDLEHEHAVFSVLLASYLAARTHDIDLAKEGITAASAQANASGFPTVRAMLAVAQAELARASGRPETAVRILKAKEDGTELYQAHVVLMNAYADVGDTKRALAEAQWLAEHRGRAYIEYGSHAMLQSMNVAESDLAPLRQAELYARLGQIDQARQQLARFYNIWPQAGELGFLATRLKTLNEAIKTPRG